MINLPKYKTIEIKEFPLIFDHSDPIFEYKAYSIAQDDREKQIREYAISKVGTNYIIRDFPNRLSMTNSSLPFSSIRIDCIYYSHDNNVRVAVSIDDYGDCVYVICQTATK